MIKGVHHVAICTSDLDRLEQFYREAFGFQRVGDQMGWAESAMFDKMVGLRGSAARVAILNAGTCYLELFEYLTPPTSDNEAARPFDRGYTHFSVEVTDIEEELPRLRAAGMRFGDNELGGGGGVRGIYGYDPEGNIIEIQETMSENPFALEHIGPMA